MKKAKKVVEQPQLPGTELLGAEMTTWWHYNHPYAEFTEYRRIMGIPDTGPVIPFKGNQRAKKQQGGD
jgi:hypothetical protein